MADGTGPGTGPRESTFCRFGCAPQGPSLIPITSSCIPRRSPLQEAGTGGRGSADFTLVAGFPLKEPTQQRHKADPTPILSSPYNFTPCPEDSALHVHTHGWELVCRPQKFVRDPPGGLTQNPIWSCLRICFSGPVGFKRNRFHYWKFFQKTHPTKGM